MELVLLIAARMRMKVREQSIVRSSTPSSIRVETSNVFGRPPARWYSRGLPTVILRHFSNCSARNMRPPSSPENSLKCLSISGSASAARLLDSALDYNA